MASRPNSVDLDTICLAVVAKLQTISGIGRVEDRPGGAPTWLKERGRDKAYWEVDVASDTEGLSSTSTFTQYTDVVIDGYMEFRFENPGSSAKPFRQLLQEVKRILRNDEDLGGVVCQSELPQANPIDLVTFQDAESAKLCHHVRITIQYQSFISFDPG